MSNSQHISYPAISKIRPYTYGTLTSAFRPPDHKGKFNMNSGKCGTPLHTLAGPLTPSKSKTSSYVSRTMFPDNEPGFPRPSPPKTYQLKRPPPKEGVEPPKSKAKYVPTSSNPISNYFSKVPPTVGAGGSVSPPAPPSPTYAPPPPPRADTDTLFSDYPTTTLRGFTPSTNRLRRATNPPSNAPTASLQNPGSPKYIPPKQPNPKTTLTVIHEEGPMKDLFDLLGDPKQ